MVALPQEPLAPLTILAGDDVFADALAALAALDARFMSRLDAICPRPVLRRREPGFEGLVAIVVSQQVSTAAANAIFSKLRERLGVPSPAAILAADDVDLRLCGLSAGKTRTIKALAVAVQEGSLPMEALATGSAEAAHAALTAIKGVGPWTADIFLLFCLGHADAWPAGDLALQEAARLALDLEKRPGSCPWGKARRAMNQEPCRPTSDVADRLSIQMN